MLWHTHYKIITSLFYKINTNIYKKALSVLIGFFYNKSVNLIKIKIIKIKKGKRKI